MYGARQEGVARIPDQPLVAKDVSARSEPEPRRGRPAPLPFCV